MDACDVYNPSSYVVLILIAPFTIFHIYFALGETLAFRRRLLHFIPFGLVVLLWGALELSGEPKTPISYSINEFVVHLDAHPLHVSFYLLLIFVFVSQVLGYYSIALKRLLYIWKAYKEHGLSIRPVVMLISLDSLFLVYTLTCVIFMSYYNNLHLGLAFNIFVPITITAISLINLLLTLPLKTDLEFMATPKEALTLNYASIVNQEKIEAKDIMSEKIRELFEEKEIYKHPHLSLQDLAVEMYTNRTYLSNCINSYYGCSFKQLVCRYRIEAAKDMMLCTHLDIKDIATEVGFNSRSSFYIAFRENVCKELSPSEWRISMKTKTTN
jgi:Response regulator containing CheY-like receiver domain and AraC-type DNA-binding domain